MFRTSVKVFQKYYFWGCTGLARARISQDRLSSSTAAINNLKFTKFQTATDGINLTLNNGATHTFPLTWIKDACRCDACFDKEHTFRKILTPFAKSQISDVAELKVEISDELVTIKWQELRGKQHTTTIKISKFTTKNENITFDKASKLWSGQTLENFPKMNYDTFIKDENGLKEYLRLFKQYGFVILKDTPLEPESIITFSKRIAYIRESSFGYVADVEVGPLSEIHPAYQGDPLPLHTDLPYREKSPGLLVLHFLKTADPKTCGENAGGKSLLSDGFYAAREAAKHNQLLFNILKRVEVPFAYHDPLSQLTYRCQQPTISVKKWTNEVHEIHFSNFARQPIVETGVADVSLTHFMQAIEMFSNILIKNQIEFFAEKGDLIAMNNRRILHARTAFDASKVERYMRTVYIDLDEVHALYEKFFHRT